MDSVLLARVQFGMTIGFHFLFPPISIGLAWFVAWLEHRAWKLKDGETLEHAKFFGKVFAILYILGIATGIVMSLQFGTNWSRFSNFVNGIFGPLLVAEVLFAFFLESIFFGIWMFGRGKVNPTLHRVSMFLVAVGATISAFWITVADSWMQTPAGFAVVDGRAVLTDFASAVFNPSSVSRFLHVMSSAGTITGFFIAGLSAWLLLKAKGGAFAKKALSVGLSVALAATILAAATGVSEAVRLGSQQKEKVAVFRGLELPAPGAAAAAPAEGVEAVSAASAPPDAAELPPVGMTKGSFDVMMYLGVFLLAYAVFCLAALGLGKLTSKPILLKLLLWSIPLPIIATEAGWIAAEVGRQPWIVYGLLKTSDAVSVSVDAWMIVFSLVLLCAVYVLFFAVAMSLIVRSAKTAFGSPAKEAA